MSCQACTQPALSAAIKYGCRAHCCSPACGHAIYEGIRQRSNGHYRVATTSLLGTAIVAHQPHLAGRRSFTLPPHVMPALIGALQQVGPQMKRGADDAELPESEQAAAPVTNQGNLLLDRLPAEVWMTVLSSLGRSDLRSFAAASQEAAMLARTDEAQAAAMQRDMPMRQAAAEYIATVLAVGDGSRTAEAATDRQRLLRRAHPNVALVALTLALALDAWTMRALRRYVNPIVEDQNAPAYLRAIDTLRTHADRQGSALYTEPLMLPAGERIMVGAIEVSLYAEQFDSHSTNYFIPTLLVQLRLSPTPTQVEQPGCIGVFDYLCHPSVCNHISSRRVLLDIPPLIQRGVVLARPETAAALILCVYMVFDARAVNRQFLMSPAIMLNAPPTGRFKTPLVHALENDTVCEAVVQLLEARNQLSSLLLTPADPLDPLQETVMFAAAAHWHESVDPAHTVRSTSKWRRTISDNMKDFVVPAARRFMAANPGAPSPFLVRNSAGFTPLMEYILHAWDAGRIIVDDTWNDGIWGIFEPMPATDEFAAGTPALAALVCEAVREDYGADHEEFIKMTLDLSPAVIDDDRILGVVAALQHLYRTDTYAPGQSRGFKRGVLAEAVHAIMRRLPPTSPRRLAIIQAVAVDGIRSSDIS